MPRVKLTARAIGALPAPKTGRVEYWDQSLPTFGLRVTDRGHRSWTVLFRVKGRQRRLTLGPWPALSLAGAREQARAALQDATRGVDAASVKQAERTADTFGEVAEKYMESYAKRYKRSWREDRRALDRDLLTKFKHRKMADIKRSEIKAILREITDRGAPILSNRTLEIVRHIYNWAIDAEIVETNPCIRIKNEPKVNRDRILNDAEISKIWRAVSSYPVQIGGRFQILFLTAQRSGEVRRMRWGDVDLASSWWTIPAIHSKNGLTHRVPLNDPAVTVLMQLQSDESGEWVFPGPTGGSPIATLRKVAETLRSQSGIDFTPHDIRRTVASRLTGDLGIARLTVSKILNHTEVGITRVYDRHSYDAEKRRALDAWGQRLTEIVSAEPAASNVVLLGAAGDAQ